MTDAPRRLLVAGRPGAGKSTLARRVAAATGIPYTELDVLHHGPGWNARPEFDDDVLALAQSPAWVTEWQYPQARPVLVAHADAIVWLDLPVRVTMTRLTRRTVSRVRHGTELWAGNVEPPLRTILTEPNHIIRWAWRTRHDYRTLVADARAEHPDLQLVHLRSQRAADAYLATLSPE
ncbi:AAA family ATPase [Aeromicrobium sp. Leaf350]|uniref:AAA family ATPase n=1 Tax=Aeromicrobium sp. Leaf350 TaxID=2876565 RepID=UPI001E33DC3F|nr:AAA family ATPase [Aeromicrobium sp. Leaf350]